MPLWYAAYTLASALLTFEKIPNPSLCVWCREKMQGKKDPSHFKLWSCCHKFGFFLLSILLAFWFLGCCTQGSSKQQSSLLKLWKAKLGKPKTLWTSSQRCQNGAEVAEGAGQQRPPCCCVALVLFLYFIFLLKTCTNFIFVFLSMYRKLTIRLFL